MDTEPPCAPQTSRTYLPVYGAEKYLEKCVNSILEQTYTNLEIILVDDGSTDDTLQILRTYEGGEVSVRIIDGPRTGIKKNVENALAHCTGDYIFLADQDDIWFPDKVNCVMECFSDKKVNLVIQNLK